MPNCDQMMKRQQVLADFGEFTLRSDNLDEVLTEACRLVGEALGTRRAKVLEIQENGQTLFLRAGVGWDPEIVGHVHLPMGEHSSETFAIREGKPIVMQDISKEERFSVPSFMKEAGVRALVNVPVRLPGGRAYGLLQVDATEPRAFGDEDTEFLRTYATILGPVIDRLQKVNRLRLTEERFRLVVENARDYAIFTSDPEDRIINWYPGAEAVFGWSADEAAGQPTAIIFTPEDRDAGENALETEVATREGSAPNVRWHVRKDGSRVFIEGTTTALRTADGSLRGFLKIGQDVTERRQADEALRASERRQRALIEGIPQLVWRSENEGQWTWGSPQWLAYTGQTQEECAGRGWLDAVHPDDRDATMAAWDRAELDGILEVEHRVRRAADGEWLWHHTRSLPVRDASSRTVEWLGTSTDIDAMRKLQARLEVLVNELQHRSRNLLGVVTAVADRTVKQGGSVEAFEERMQALSRAQGLLSKSGSDTVEVGDLVRTELAVHADRTGERVAVQGPKVLLMARQVQNFALAVHELATNAVKHGALKAEAGRLDVNWTVALDRRGRRRLALHWIESGVAIEPEKVRRRGYGTELIQEALAYALEADVDYALREDGVRCRIEMPVP